MIRKKHTFKVPKQVFEDFKGRRSIIGWNK